jgi:hypothetical protein
MVWVLLVLCLLLFHGMGVAGAADVSAILYLADVSC